MAWGRVDVPTRRKRAVNNPIPTSPSDSAFILKYLKLSLSHPTPLLYPEIDSPSCAL